jgi:hypothetical protein
VHSTSSFDSPFKGVGSNSPKVPSFAAYRNKSKSEQGPKVFQYFMVGTMGALASLGAKATVQGRSHLFLRSLEKRWNRQDMGVGSSRRAIGSMADEMGIYGDDEDPS